MYRAGTSFSRFTLNLQGLIHLCLSAFFFFKPSFFQARIKTGGAPCSEPLSVIPERSPSTVPSETPADPAVSIPVPPDAASPSSSG